MVEFSYKEPEFQLSVLDLLSYNIYTSEPEYCV